MVIVGDDELAREEEAEDLPPAVILPRRRTPPTLLSIHRLSKNIIKLATSPSWSFLAQPFSGTTLVSDGAPEKI